jgi:hypothetical protein
MRSIAGCPILRNAKGGGRIWLRSCSPVPDPRIPIPSPTLSFGKDGARALLEQLVAGAHVEIVSTDAANPLLLPVTHYPGIERL